MARKGILSGPVFGTPAETDPTASPLPSSSPAPSGTSPLAQESAVQELDPDLIDAAGVEDRLGEDSEAQRMLRESLATYGQQVPILVRPHPSEAGRYEVVYGRRRLAALRDIGRPIQAMVRQLDDHALVMAQGQENTARRDLTFIEKASFAFQLDKLGYDRKTICDALTIDLPMVSRMLRVGRAFPLDLLREIGSAPSIGRERWLALATVYEDPVAWARAASVLRQSDFHELDSDARFEAIFAAATRTARTEPAPAKPKPRPLTAIDGTALGTVRRAATSVTLSVSAKAAPGFDDWLDSNAETLMAELHARWLRDRDDPIGLRALD